MTDKQPLLSTELEKNGTSLISVILPQIRYKFNLKIGDYLNWELGDTRYIKVTKNTNAEDTAELKRKSIYAVKITRYGQGGDSIKTTIHRDVRDWLQVSAEDSINWELFLTGEEKYIIVTKKEEKEE